MKISQSKVKQWRKCRFAFHQKYIEKLKKRVKSRPLQFGSMIHEMIEAHANGDDPFDVLNNQAVMHKKLFDAERELYGNIIEDVRTIMTEYFAYWKKDDLKYTRVKGRNAEHEFEVDIDGITFTGKIDAFAKSKKLRWLVEHKSFKRVPSEDHRWRNVQSAVYSRFTDILGFPSIDGTVWDYVRSKPPTIPEPLKNGGLSRRAIDTLPSVLKKAIVDNGLRMTDYSEMIQQVEDRRKEWFFRVYTPFSATTVDVIFNDFLESAREIERLAGKDQTRNIDLHCDYCDYEPLCRAAFQNLDVDFIKEREYYVEEEDKDAGAVEEVA